MKNLLTNGAIVLALAGGFVHAVKIIWWDFPQVKASSEKSEQKIDKSFKLQCMMGIELLKEKEKIIKFCSEGE